MKFPVFDLSNRHHRYRARILGFNVPKLKAGGSVKPFDSFFRKGDDNFCWLWGGRLDRDGYGLYCSGKGKTDRAHRFAYQECYGTIPVGMCVCHHCDNPSCVNPKHLFIGHHRDNVADKVSKNRQAKGEKTAKVKLTEKQARIVKSLRGSIRGVHAAKMFGITPSAVCAIWKGRSWKHIEI